MRGFITEVEIDSSLKIYMLFMKYRTFYGKMFIKLHSRRLPQNTCSW